MLRPRRQKSPTVMPEWPHSVGDSSPVCFLDESNLVPAIRRTCSSRGEPCSHRSTLLWTSSFGVNGDLDQQQAALCSRVGTQLPPENIMRPRRQRDASHGSTPSSLVYLTCTRGGTAERSMPRREIIRAGRGRSRTVFPLLRLGCLLLPQTCCRGAILRLASATVRISLARSSVSASASSSSQWATVANQDLPQKCSSKPGAACTQGVVPRNSFHEESDAATDAKCVGCCVVVREQ